MTAPSLLARIPLFAMAVVLAGLTLLALLLFSDSSFRHWGLWKFGFFLIPAVLAVVYLNEYRKLPYEPWHFAPAAPKPTPPAAAPTASAGPAASPVAPGEEEPFVDPVEEADRLDREAPPASGGDGSTPDAP